MMFFYAAMLETEEQRSKFESIYEKYYGLMYHIAFSITHNAQHAEDCVHETCLALIDRIDALRVDSGKEFTAYLSTLTRNRTIDYLRKWGSGKSDAPEDAEQLTDDAEIPENVILSNLALEQAIGQLAEMPEMYRGPLVLKVKGYSIREIAQSLDLTEGAVKTRIFRARQILSRAFQT